jgi:hypothetical protein
MNLHFLVFLFLGWSISSTLVNGSIFDNFRNWLLVFYPLFGKLLSCVRCSSFWIGLFIFSFLVSEKIFVPFPELPSNTLRFFLLNYLAMPFIQSGFSVVVESFVIFLVKDSSIGFSKNK